jgi:ribosomal protein S27E
MAITLTCPSCGKRSSVADQHGGKRVKCPHCAGVIVAPAGPAAQAPSAAVRSERAAPQGGGYACGVCGGSFGVEEVYDQQGTIICHACYAAAQAKATAAAGEAKTAARAAEAARRQAMTPTKPASRTGAATKATPAARAPRAESAGPPAPAAPSGTAEASHPGKASLVGRKRKRLPAYLPYAIAGGVAAVVVAVIVAMRPHDPSKQVAAGQPADGSADAPRSVPASRPAPAVATNPDAPTPAATAPEIPGVSRWEMENAPRIADLRAQARQLEDGNDLAGASAKYKALFAIAKTAGPSDKSPQMGKDLAAAQLCWDAVEAQRKTADATPAPADSAQAAKKPPAPAPVPADVQAAFNKDWEAANKPAVEQMLAQAQQLKGLDKVAVLLKYKQLFDLVGEHANEIQDPALKQKLAAASDARKQMMAAMRDSDESRAATVSSLLDSGLRALEEGKWKAGRESLSDARHLIEGHSKSGERLKNADYLTALNGIAVAYLGEKETQKAGDLFDDAAPLGKAALGDPPREIVWNRAVLDMRQKFKVLRAVKGLREYMEKHKVQADEDLLNLLGTALSIANQNAPADPRFLNECADFYVLHNSELEKTKPGQHRWGVKWVSPEEAKAHAEEQRKAAAAIQAAAGRADAALARYKQLQFDARPKGRNMARTASDAQVDAGRREYEAAMKEVAQIKSQYPQQPWLTDIRPVIPPRPVVVVASAAQDPSAGPAPDPSPMPSPAPVVPDPTPDPAVPSDPAPRPVAPPVRPEPAAVHHTARYALAFPIDRYRLVTAAEALGSASQVRMEDGQGTVLDAKVVARGDRLALLEVDPAAMAGHTFRYLNVAGEFPGGAVRCAAFPEASVFGPEVVMLKGDNVAAPPAGGNWMVGLSDHPRLAGSPLLSASGDVVGVVLASRDDPRTRLPAIGFREMAEFLTANQAAPAAPCRNPDALGVFQVSAEGE